MGKASLHPGKLGWWVWQGWALFLIPLMEHSFQSSISIRNDSTYTRMVSHPMHGKIEKSSLQKGIYMHLYFVFFCTLIKRSSGHWLSTGQDLGFCKINQHIKTLDKSLSDGKWIVQTVHHQVSQFPWHPAGNWDTATTVFINDRLLHCSALLRSIGQISETVSGFDVDLEFNFFWF